MTITVLMRKPFLITVAVWLLIVSCKKDDAPPPANAPPHFVNTRLTHFSNYRLFTQTGEINNSPLIQGYASEFSNYFFKPADRFHDPNYQEIVYINDDSIINLTPGRAFDGKRTNTDVYDKYTTGLLAIQNDTSAVALYIGKYKTYQRQVTPSGYVYFDVESPVYFLKKQQDTLFVPIMRYIIFYRKNGIVSFGADTYNNVFSPAGVNKLGPNDTLLVQSFDAVLEKKR
jgi:hypothetical protein